MVSNLQFLIKMEFDLKANEIDAMRSIFSKHQEVKRVVLYGSRAKGTNKQNSDIDLTLEGENLNLSILNQIEVELDDLLLPYKLDLSLFKQISNPDLVEHINRVGIVFYQK